MLMHENAYALSGLAQVLSQLGEQYWAGEVASCAYKAALNISDAKDQYMALVKLLQYLPLDRQEQCLQKVLAAVRVIDNTADRIQGLVSLVQYLPASQRMDAVDQALKLAKTMGDEHSFWMPDTVRLDVLNELRNQFNPDSWLKMIVDLGKLILQVQKQGTPVSYAVARWAELASASTVRKGPSGVVELLEVKIERLVKEGDTAEALAWVDAGKILAQALGGELETIVLLGERSVERVYRQTQDKRHLEYFLERQEQTAEFNRLLDDSESGWALHYIGMGGVGKTMLLRHITADLAPQRKAPTSRVDFDHLNPEYPARRPGQLLLQLGDELQSYISTSRAESSFRRFQNSVVQLHEALSSELFVSNPLTSIEGKDIKKMLQAFCNFLRLLPQPVILILDTCEELSKLQPVGAALPSLEATFKILEDIHTEVPTVRVIFAGRRFLAQSGQGWTIATMHLRESGALLPQDKPYMRLHEIQGFTEDEAHTYLTRIKKLTLSSEMEHVILKRSLDTGTVIPIISNREENKRYNPFDLALYADWLREDPTLTADFIASGRTDPYVEMRIVRRIKQENVQRVLPAVVLLGRFDKAMLRPAFDGSDDEFAEVYRELSNMEWIEFQPEGETSFLEIDRNLFPRLLEYYKSSDRRRLLDDACRRLGSKIANLIDERPLGQLSVTHVDTALLLVPDEEGAALWDRLAQRIADKGDWGWARRVTERLLGKNGAVASEKHEARAAVQATNIAAIIHEQPEFNMSAVRALWTEVSQTASADPNPEVSRWLLQRALAGQIATSQEMTQPRPLDDQLTAFWQLVVEFLQPNSIPIDTANQARLEQLAGSLCAAIDALLERAETNSDISLIPDPEQLTNWALRLENNFISTEILAFALTLAGRALALHTRWEDATRLMEKALTALPTNTISPSHQRWADWRVPAFLRDWVWLQVLHTLPTWFLPLDLDQLVAWQQEVVPRLDLIDAERLVSAILRLRLARGVVEHNIFDALARVESYKLERQPICYAHRATQPLFVTLADGWLALGNGEQAVKVLDDRLIEAEKTGRDKATVRAAQQAKLRVFRRMRMAKSEPVLIDQSARSSDPDDVTLALPLIAVTSPPNPKAFPPVNRASPLNIIHAWWRSQSTLAMKMAREAADSFRNLELDDIINVVKEDTDFDRISLILDRQELSLLPLPESSAREHLQFDSVGWLTDHLAKTEQGLRLMLRSIALDVESNLWDSTDRAVQGEPKRNQEERLQEWATKVGPRWIAELALDEGELLALRLPQQGAHLLDLAYGWFIDANDPVGALFTSICSTIATIHANDLAKARDKVRQLIQPSYEHLIESKPVSGLPTWASLLAEPEIPDPVLLLETKNSAWGGWLERLVRCVVRTLESDNTEKSTKRVQSWLATRYAERLPLELDLSPTDEIPPTVSKDFIPSIGLLVLGLGIIRGGAWLRSELASRTIINLSIAAEPGSSLLSLEATQEVPVIVRLQQRSLVLRLGWPLTRLLPEVTTESIWRTPGLQAYRAAAKDLPPELVKELTELQKRLRSRSLHVPLQVDPALTAVSWEALLALALPSSQGETWMETFQFWRVGEPLPAQPEAAASTLLEDSQTVCVLCDPTWGLMVEQGWKPLERKVDMSDDVYKLQNQERMTVLHVIGTPVRTSAGLRIQISSTSLRSVSKVASEASVRGAGSLISADSLPLKFSTLVLVQAEPVGALERLDTEREQAFDLRAYAAEAFTAGARAVIMLPALPQKLAEVAIAVLATEAHNSMVLDLQQLLTAVSNMRQAIATWNAVQTTDSRTWGRTGKAQTDSQLELALDVCLFARQQSDEPS